MIDLVDEFVAPAWVATTSGVLVMCNQSYAAQYPCRAGADFRELWGAEVGEVFIQNNVTAYECGRAMVFPEVDGLFCKIPLREGRILGVEIDRDGPLKEVERDLVEALSLLRALRHGGGGAA